MAGINGWYYDTQLDNKLTSVSLHSNKWYDESINNGENEPKGGFVNWDHCKDDNGFGNHGKQTDGDQFLTNAGGTNTGRGCGYGIDPICKSILAEDFNVTISNTWSDFGGDPVSEVWNGARTKYGPYLKNAIESLNLLYNKNKEVRNEQDLGKVMDFFTGIVDKAGTWIKDKSEQYDIDIVRFFNKALISQGTRFSYYGGTGISFGNLGMKFTIFPKWDNNNKFISVTEQVNKLYPYFIGRVESFEKVDKLAKNQEIDLTNNMFYDFLKKCFMWQTPPNDYKSEIFDVDDIQEGTLKLKLGCYYELANMLCSDMMLNFSKSMVKNPRDNSVSPLFCDVTLNLRPASKFTDRALKKFIGGLDENGRVERKELKELNRSLSANLTNERTNFLIDYGSAVSVYNSGLNV